MKQKNIWSGVGAASFLLFGLFFSSAHASPLYTGVPVSDAGTDNTLSAGNTARKVGIAPDGNIYVVYHGSSQGVRIARSTNRGQSFGPSIQLAAGNFEPEVAVDQNNIVYVAWVNGADIYLTQSTDDGLTYSTPTIVGTGASATVHIAVSNPYVYIILRNATKLFYNSNSGVGAFASSTVDTAKVYADVHIDPVTGYVYVQDDNPSVYYLVSTNHGQSFSTATSTGQSVLYSTAVLASSNSGQFLYIGGGSGSSFNINLNTNVATTVPFSATQNNTTRSLAADSLGNLVDGFITSTSTSYEVSTNQGVSFNPPVVVSTSTAYTSVGINSLYGDIVAAYEQGSKIYVSIYQDEIPQTAAQANLSLGFTGVPSSATAGDSTSLTAAIHNASYSPAVNATATFTIPSQLTLTSSTPSCSGTTGTVVCSFTSIAPGATQNVVFNFSVSPSALGLVSISGTASSTTADPDFSDNTGIASFTIIAAQSQAPAPAVSGGIINPEFFVLPDFNNISFTINSGAAQTSNPAVTISNSVGSDIKSMAISNTADFYGIGIQPFSAAVPWTLCSDCRNGSTYTVYIKFYTQYGQSVTQSHTIMYNPSAKTAKTVTIPPAPQPAAANPDSSPFLFNVNLKLGMKHPDVIKLQQYLNTHGFPVAASGPGSPGNETTLFGFSTKKSVMGLQAANPEAILLSIGITSPTGFFATSTRAFVNTHP